MGEDEVVAGRRSVTAFEQGPPPFGRRRVAPRQLQHALDVAVFARRHHRHVGRDRTAFAVSVTASNIPNIAIIGLAITYLFLRSAWYVLHESIAELRAGEASAERRAQSV
jgi:hypothetical protein